MKASVLAALLALSGPASAQDWPQFRGPDGQGRSKAVKVPLKWGDTAPNLAWKTPVEGLGWSSPVVSGDRVWLTTATAEGRSLRAVCLDLATGKPLRDVEVFKLDAPGKGHKKNSHASPTPVLDGTRVYVHFGPHGTACLSDQGAVLWKQRLPYEPVHGPGGSPMLLGELLIYSADGGDTQNVYALDRKTGAVRWKVPRPANAAQKKFAFSTPMVVELGAARQVVSPGADAVTAHDPATGRILWWFRYPGGYSVIPRPAFGHGLVFLSSGYDKPSLYAIRVDGRGDVTDTHLAWRLDRSAPHSPSPLLVGDELYIVDDRGIATCLDAKTGKQHWQERVGGNHSASPFHAAGRVYFQDEDGVTTVVKADTKFEKLAQNTIKGRTYASPVPLEGALLLRTDTQLLRFDVEK